MKYTILSTLFILTLGVSGCGENTAEESAETFANAISSKNLNVAEELSTESVKEEIEQLRRLCIKSKVNQLADLAIPILNTMDNKLHSKVYSERLAPALKKFQHDSKEALKLFRQETEAKYGFAEDVSEEIRKKVYNQLLVKFSETSTALIEEEFKVFELSSDSSEDIKKIASYFLITGSTRVTFKNKHKLMRIVEKVIMDKNIKPSSECIDKYTEFGFIDDINIIETKTISPDKVKIRVEIIQESGQSKKTFISMEMIQNKWKVSDMNFDSFF